MLRSIIIILASLPLVLVANGQNPQSYKNSLSQPTGENSASVQLIEAADAAEVVNSNQGRSRSSIKGYRVRIFFDNSQNARQYATATMNRFKDMHPDIPAYLNYENPYFKVTAGNFLTEEEAIILWGNIKETFEKAYVVSENIPVTAFRE